MAAFFVGGIMFKLWFFATVACDVVVNAIL